MPSSLHHTDTTGSIIDNLCQHFLTVITRLDFPLSMNPTFPSSIIIKDKTDGLSKISSLITLKAQAGVFLELGRQMERADSPTLVRGALPEEGWRGRVGEGS